MKHGIFLLVVILYSGFATSQSPFIDSVRQVSLEGSGTTQVDALNNYGYIMLSYDFEKSRQLIDQALEKSKDLNYMRGLAEANLYRGVIELNIGGYSNASSYLNEASSLAKAANETYLEGRIYASVGVLKENMNQLDSAIHYYNKSFLLLQDSLHPLYLSYLYLNMASYYQAVNKQEERLEYLLRSWKIRKRLKQPHPMIWSGAALAAYYIERGDFKTAEDYLKKSKDALKSDTVDNEEISVIYKHRAMILANLGKHQRALIYFNNARKFYEKNPFPWDLVNLLIEIGAVQVDVANYEISLKYFLTALRVAEANGFKRQIALCHFRIGWVYYQMKQFDQSFEFAKKSLRLARESNFEFEEGSALNLLGLLYLDSNALDSAEYSFNEALKLRVKNKFRMGEASTLENLGTLYERKGELKKAEQYNLSSLKIEQQIGHAIGICYAYMNLGSLYTRQSRYSDAERYLNLAEALAQKINSKDLLADIFKEKRELWNGQGNYKKALYYSFQFENLRDSLLNQNIRSRILTMQSDYELDQKNDEIKLLDQQRQLQLKELQLREEQIGIQRKIIITGVILIFIFGIAAYVVFRLYRRVKFLNLEILERNEEITAQSEELREANEVLGSLNRSISEQKEEIRVQSERLAESNKTISRINEQLEDKIKERTSELKSAYRELDTFFYRSSHDFRRPLTTFMGLSEVAKISIKDPHALELFDQVSITARNLDKMLLKLQSMSIVANEDLVLTEVFLKDTIDTQLIFFQQDILRKKIVVNNTVGATVSISSYPDLIKILIHNILENSILFSQNSGGTIKFEATSNAQTLILKIEDNGIGIDEMYIPRVFDMYFRASEHSKGNGLGLYIVKKIIDRLGGKIDIQSKINEGTKVMITFKKPNS